MSGPAPKAYTYAYRWLLENGVTLTEFAERAGVHATLAARHLSGRGAVSKRIASEYHRAFPGGPWEVGVLRRFKRPLRVRTSC